jgi:hypothetical protein
VSEDELMTGTDDMEGHDDDDDDLEDETRIIATIVCRSLILVFGNTMNYLTELTVWLILQGYKVVSSKYKQYSQGVPIFCFMLY